MITFGSDIGEMILQRTLSSNTLGLQSSIERMTSGYKVNHAKDNAAGYSIITDLNTQISSMLQVQQNTEDGISMLQIAGGGLEEIQSLLERLRSLATQASNGNYGSDERASMQAEADAIIEEIERLRNSIEYNGMNVYESSRKNDAVTTSVNRLSRAIKVSNNDTNQNAGVSYPEINNDTAPAAFTPAAGGSRLLSAPSSVSLLTSGESIEGAVDLAGNETREISIDGISYKITNRTS